MDRKFFEKYQSLWDIRKSQFIKKSPTLKTPKPPPNTTRPAFYYKDSYEISSVKQFLYLLDNFFEKNEKAKADKARLIYKKSLLNKLKIENSKKTEKLFDEKHRLKLKTNSVFSPKAYKTNAFTSKSKDFSLKTVPCENFESEIKWLTMKEVDIQLSRIMTANTKVDRKTPFNDQLLESPMFKKGAKSIDHAFNYYIDQKLFKMHSTANSNEYYENNEIIKKIDFFKGDSLRRGSGSMGGGELITKGVLRRNFSINPIKNSKNYIDES